ncbi:MAG: hypothetical protein LBL71_01460, partial [Endomicrobium sp.]|nr:hypothetical protein [Endomicrobium sp.]
AVAAVICAIFVKKRDREDYVRGFTAGRATSQIPVEEDFLGGHRNLDSIRVAMHGTPEEPPTPPALPLEPSGTHTSTDNPFSSGYIEGTNTW